MTGHTYRRTLGEAQTHHRADKRVKGMRSAADSAMEIGRSTKQPPRVSTTIGGRFDDGQSRARNRPRGPALPTRPEPLQKCGAHAAGSRGGDDGRGGRAGVRWRAKSIARATQGVGSGMTATSPADDPDHTMAAVAAEVLDTDGAWLGDPQSRGGLADRPRHRRVLPRRPRGEERSHLHTVQPKSGRSGVDHRSPVVLSG